MSTDVENGAVKVHYLIGYPSLAAFIASDKSKSTAIYRRFDRLGARNLLHLQSELTELEARQDALDAQDLKTATVDEKGDLRDWAVFTEKAKDDNNVREKARMALMKEIREKVKEYREALLLESTLICIKPPTSRTLEAFQNVFHNINEAGETFPSLRGNSASLYDNRNDLVALATFTEEDRLTSFLRHYCAILFTKKRTNTPLTYMSEARLRLTVTVITIMLAFTLLFGAIYHLYSTAPNNNKLKLALIALYTMLFAACVGLVTNARRAEVFGACAAYAAVLVVFVSGQLGDGA